MRLGLTAEDVASCIHWEGIHFEPAKYNTQTRTKLFSAKKRRRARQPYYTTRTRGLTRAIADMLSRSDWLNQQTWLFSGVAPTPCPTWYDSSHWALPANRLGTRRIDSSYLGRGLRVWQAPVKAHVVCVLMRFKREQRADPALSGESKIIIQGFGCCFGQATWACRVDVEQMFSCVFLFFDRFFVGVLLLPRQLAKNIWPNLAANQNKRRLSLSSN